MNQIYPEEIIFLLIFRMHRLSLFMGWERVFLVLVELHDIR